MTYTWTSITRDRYWVPTLTDPEVERWPFFNRLMRAYSSVGPTDGVFTYTSHTAIALDEIVASVVQDFREAVGAAFFDGAKDDPTLVPSSCVVHADAIILYTIVHRCRFIDYTDQDNYRYISEDYRPAWRRATIFRREQAGYLKRWLVGDLFPETVPPEVSDGIPFYTAERPATGRSL